MEDSGSLHELLIISEMMEEAEEHGLLTEVVWSFSQACSNSDLNSIDDYKSCANIALNEWIK
ncbi:MAG: hypothetical protein GY787_32495 [Alteromonadales bacterium]|nr:hypothetical protein [Alteromonadales bacterium]